MNITVTDNDADGWCAQAWARTNLPSVPQSTFQACGVAVQKSYTLPLPGGARCNVGFVEVQIGRIDPSNGNAIELGPAQRMANPCPPPAAPPPPPPPIDSKIDFNWLAFPKWTRNQQLLVREVPPGAAVELWCRGKGCPGKRRAIAVKNGTADLHRVLRGRHLRPGAVLDVRVTRADLIGKVLRFKIRRGLAPTHHRYCLPVGATAPTRC